jgi:short-subunit dehydrogenase
MADIAKTMIVTGASSGIGRALSLAAARDGYSLVMTARRADRLEETAHAIREAGGRCEIIAGDVTAAAMPARIVQTALHAFERIDVVVNNAGGGTYGPLLEQSDAAIEAQWQLELAAPLRLARAALASLEATNGHLVFVGTGGVRVPLPNYGAYQPAKAAVRIAAIQLRRELRGRGIAVTYVDPGLVASGFHTAMGIERTTHIPAASPERVARAILRGIARRRAVVNAVLWQTAGAVLGEWFGALSDPVINARFAPKRLATPEPSSESSPIETEAGEGATTVASSFEKALEPVARRMERVKLPTEFLRGALVPDAKLELGALAMEWAGMPNKNERAVLREALDALAGGGFLEPLEEGSWKVLRAAD